MREADKIVESDERRAANPLLGNVREMWLFSIVIANKFIEDV